MKNTGIIRERVTIDTDEEFVVLLIGMRINRWWKVHKWLPIALAMRKMIVELTEDKESGLISGEYRSIGNPIVYLQYWRSYDELEAYSCDHSKKHRKSWTNFYKQIGLGGDVGIWHEAYRISPGNYECVYINMPPFGLGRTGTLVPAERARNSSRGRMEKWKKEPGTEIQKNNEMSAVIKE